MFEVKNTFEACNKLAKTLCPFKKCPVFNPAKPAGRARCIFEKCSLHI